jgi:hypothetical protein
MESPRLASQEPLVHLPLELQLLLQERQVAREQQLALVAHVLADELVGHALEARCTNGLLPEPMSFTGSVVVIFSSPIGRFRCRRPLLCT